MAEEKYGALLWAETPITPDEPDVLGGGDVVEGIGGSWRQVRRVVGCDGLFGVFWYSRWRIFRCLEKISNIMIYIKNPIRHSQVHESTSYVFMEQVKETLNVAVPYR
jgi:hypothetical protein